ncbi:MAG: DUF4349 domain-containing protein [Bacteroidetes bacterium]|nr:DUF4349 domain-containing protein [Bacteroidota bacterium]
MNLSNLIHAVCLLCLFILFSCGGSESSESFNAGYENTIESGLEADDVIDEPLEITERKLIKTGTISFKTASVDSTRKKVLDATTRHNGYIASDSETKSYGKFSTTIVIRVPNNNFDPLLNEISEGVEAFDQKDILVEDVTEEFVDAEARVKTKKELEIRYHELLKEAKSVSEMLEIEQQIGDLRAEIESLEGRLKFLTSQVKFSTLTVTFYEEYEETKGWGAKFSKSFGQGWDNLIYFFIGLTTIWPFLILILIGLFFLRKYLKKSKTTNAKK